MDLILLGPGRAGLAVALAVRAAGHRLVGVAGRDAEKAAAAAERLETVPLGWGEELPPADLVLVAVRDGAIADVAGTYAGKCGAVAGAVHLSGLVPVAVLSSLAIPAGSFHPLQTLPTPEAGAGRLAGAWVAITCEDDRLGERLQALAASIDARPFRLDDAAKALYHAAAACAANYPIAALFVAQRLFERAGVPFEAAEPLVRAVVDNVFDLGPEAALTGPIARGDVATVRAQARAVREAAPELAEAFETLARVTGIVAGDGDVVEEALR